VHQVFIGQIGEGRRRIRGSNPLRHQSTPASRFTTRVWMASL
jgi:hypothetical protein